MKNVHFGPKIIIKQSSDMWINVCLRLKPVYLYLVFIFYMFDKHQRM